MAALKQKITPCLWFDNEAEDAAKFYTAVFADSQIKQISRYTEAGREIHGKAPGSVMVAEFELEGQAVLQPRYFAVPRAFQDIRCAPLPEVRGRG